MAVWPKLVMFESLLVQAPYGKIIDRTHFPNQVSDMMTHPCCKWWMSPAVRRSNGSGMLTIETLHGRTALKNGSFWTLLSTYILSVVHEVNQIRSQIWWHLLAANDGWAPRFIGRTVRACWSSKPYMVEPHWKMGLFGHYCHLIAWSSCMKWTKSGLRYDDTSLLQMMDKPCGS